MRILLSAYACEPGRGSEPGVGWSWANELARLGHEVTVITRTANRNAIDQPARRPLESLHFLYYDLPPWIERWRKLRYAKALYYILWQWSSARHLRRLFPSPPFDLVHHITYVAVRYPSFMGSLGIPFWFGPVSGGETVPAALRPGFSASQRCREWLRDVSNRLVRFDPLMRRTFRYADKILVTHETLRLIPKHCRTKSKVQLAIGLADHDLPPRPGHPKSRAIGPQLLYVGRLLEWKGIDIALQAVHQIREEFPDTRFTIIGQGPAKPMLQALCRKLRLQDAVRWVAWQPHRRLSEYYQSTDLLLFPSLRDSGGMVVLEALAHGLPVVCTDLGGPAVTVDSTCGRVVSTAGHSRERLAQAMADTLSELLRVPDLIESLSYGARLRARQFKFEDLVKLVYADVPIEMKTCAG